VVQYLLADCLVEMNWPIRTFFLLSGWALWLPAAERINQEGRILGPAPVVTNTVLFNTAEADAIVAAMQIFPVTSAWNEDISRRPVLANSDAMIAQIISDLATDRRTLRMFHEMNFVLVKDAQVMEPIRFVTYPSESDPSPYPIPWKMPVEGWPRETGSLTLQEWQVDVNDDGGDRHALVVQPGTGVLWEMWQAKLIDTNQAAATNWQASNGAKFDLKSNALRPAGWTSGDAAGLAMFPALPRYDECERGRVEHAMRLVVKRTRLGPIYPATHEASVGSLTNPNIPAMGQRLRLKASFNIPANWTTYEKAVLLGLKKYGALVADNGNFFSISVTPDDRYPSGAFSHMSSVGITNFEVIQTTGPNEGPRSPGAPRADAGPDISVAVGVPTPLQGSVTWSNVLPAIRWTVYSGPGSVTFGDPARTNTSASFSTPGAYTLMLSADDGTHAVAYDAAVVTVTTAITARINRSGTTNVVLTWTGGSAPYVLESSLTLPAAQWTAVATNNTNRVTVSATGVERFYRVRNW